MNALEQISQRLPVPLIAKISARELGMLHHVPTEIIAMTIQTAPVIRVMTALRLRARIHPIPYRSRPLRRHWQDQRDGAHNDRAPRAKHGCHLLYEVSSPHPQNATAPCLGDACYTDASCMAFDLETVRHRMPDRRVDWFSSVDSTMTIAARLAHEGCASGTVVGADEQLAGVGRHGHSWHSEPGSGLYVSIVLCLPVSARVLPILSLALGIATQEAIAKTTGLAVDLRWPNDVMVGDKKCAGILALIENHAVVAGIGINVNHQSFPQEIESTATSLKLAGARNLSREDLLIALLEAVDDSANLLATRGTDAILRLFTRSSSYAQGRRVRVEQEGATIEGVTCGLDESGFLCVRKDDGKEVKILAGGVRPARPV